MAEKKIIAVVGATGMQGGGLVRAIVKDPDKTFVARALTRDVNSDKAKTLAMLGVEVVSADLDDVAGLKRAFAGAYGVFLFDQFLGTFLPGKRICAGQEPGRGRQGNGSATCHLVYAGRYAKMGAAI